VKDLLTGYRRGVAEDVHVWIVGLDEAPAGPAAAMTLDADERRRAAALRSATLRRRFVAARAARRDILGRCLAVPPESIRFGLGAGGKPHVEGAGHRVQFSASLSDALALVAVAYGIRVGVDLERVRRLDDVDAVSRRAFSSAELRQWLSQPPGDRLQAFYRVWTRKEAYLKGTGDGIAGDLAGVHVGLGARAAAVVGTQWSVVDLAIADGWAAALAAERSDVAVRCRRYLFSRSSGSSG
jgi:4'-phosphopantetheinyl transferase